MAKLHNEFWSFVVFFQCATKELFHFAYILKNVVAQWLSDFFKEPFHTIQLRRGHGQVMQHHLAIRHHPEVVGRSLIQDEQHFSPPVKLFHLCFKKLQKHLKTRPCHVRQQQGNEVTTPRSQGCINIGELISQLYSAHRSVSLGCPSSLELCAGAGAHFIEKEIATAVRLCKGRKLFLKDLAPFSSFL